MNQPDDEILTLEEVAVYLKAGKKTVYRLVSALIEYCPTLLIEI